MCPFFKKGEDQGNYLPVSLTSIVCKLRETALKGDILNNLQQTAALSAAQHVFIPPRSRLSNLLVAEERITLLMDSGEGVDLVYLDFAKAFDSVNHRVLCDKMLAYGIHRSIFDWTR